MYPSTAEHEANAALSSTLAGRAMAPNTREYRDKAIQQQLMTASLDSFALLSDFSQQPGALSEQDFLQRLAELTKRLSEVPCTGDVAPFRDLLVASLRWIPDGFVLTPDKAPTPSSAPREDPFPAVDGAGLSPQLPLSEAAGYVVLIFEDTLNFIDDLTGIPRDRSVVLIFGAAWNDTQLIPAFCESLGKVTIVHVDPAFEDDEFHPSHRGFEHHPGGWWTRKDSQGGPRLWFFSRRMPFVAKDSYQAHPLLDALHLAFVDMLVSVARNGHEVVVLDTICGQILPSLQTLARDVSVKGQCSPILLHQYSSESTLSYNGPAYEVAVELASRSDDLLDVSLVSVSHHT